MMGYGLRVDEAVWGGWDDKRLEGKGLPEADDEGTGDGVNDY